MHSAGLGRNRTSPGQFAPDALFLHSGAAAATIGAAENLGVARASTPAWMGEHPMENGKQQLADVDIDSLLDSSGGIRGPEGNFRLPGALPCLCFRRAPSEDTHAAAARCERWLF